MSVLASENLLGIGIAALGGAAVGIDRQRAYRENEPGAIGGLRTFTLLGTIAGLCGFLITSHFVAPAVVILAGSAFLVLIVRLAAGRISRDATTEVAAMAVLASGMTAGLGHLGIASALYAWTVLLLIEKSWLHALVNRIGVVELEAAAQFAAMALIVLPLLPSRTFGPHGILNLRSIWILVLVFSGISFLGYLARKTLGNEVGWVLSGLIGGLVSSTQVTFAFSRECRSYPESHIPLFGGVMAATTVSMLRVCALCTLLRPSLAAATLVNVAIPTLIGSLATLYSLRRPSRTAVPFDEKSPLRVFSAVYLALIFIGAQFLVTFAHAWWGNTGTLGSAALLGAFDIDSVVASLLPMVRQGMQTSDAAKVVTLGIFSNTVVKFVIAVIWGSAIFRRYSVFGFIGILTGLIGSFIISR
jgi:uncharacterized membrane protein (DUF4010 family)